MADRNPVQHYIEKPIFAGAKVALLKCVTAAADGQECPWEFVGPKDKFQAAWTEHYRQEHSEEVAVALTHGGGTRLGDLLAMQRPTDRIILAR